MIASRPYRLGLVGASSLAGKEVADCLPDSSLADSDLVLLGDEDAGQVTAAADEVNFIQKIDVDSFAGMDIVFFADDPAITRKYWKAARSAGASIVDMTYALEGEAGVLVRAPWSAGAMVGDVDVRVQEPDLTTPAVVTAHPAAVMLLLIMNRVQAKFPTEAVSVTVFEPASQHGRAGMDELHQQTVSLLSFQALPREQFDAQVAFSLSLMLGEGAKVNLPETKKRIVEHYAALAVAPRQAFSLQLVQAPVFHGYVMSALVELQSSVSAEQVESAVYGDHVDVVSDESDAPSHLSVVGQPEVQVRVTIASNGETTGRRFWLWLGADNLKLAALNAIACAIELARLRPTGKVQ